MKKLTAFLLSCGLVLFCSSITYYGLNVIGVFVPIFPGELLAQLDPLKMFLKIRIST